MPNSLAAVSKAWLRLSRLEFFELTIVLYSNRSGRCEWMSALKPKPERQELVKSVMLTPG